jgi:hypothetical protein
MFMSDFAVLIQLTTFKKWTLAWTRAQAWTILTDNLQKKDER